MSSAEAVELLLQCLREMEATPDLPDVDANDEDAPLPAHAHPTVEAATIAAVDALTTHEGGCDWEAIEEVRHAGYDVFPGERDRFGWLVGCIATRKGVICYG